MTGLIRAELRRVFSRRLYRVLVLIACGVVLFVLGRAFFVYDRDVAAAHRRAERQAELINSQGGQQRGGPPICFTQSPDEPPPPAEFCKRFAGGPTTAEELYHDPRFHTAQAVHDGTQAVVVAVTILGFVIGASFVGAEWNAGTMQALLFWEPRRGRVLLAKGLALVVALVAFAIVLHAETYGLTRLLGATRGESAGLTGGLQVAALLTAVRGFGAIAFAGLLGYGIAGLARVTAASLGVAFGYFVILENLIRGLRPGWQRFLVSENIAAVVSKHTGVTTAHAKSIVESGYVLTGVRGAVTLGCYLALLLGAFYVSFTRRDVT